MAKRLPNGSSIQDRLDFRSMPEPNSGCKIWLGAVNAQNYGKMTVDGKSQQAHRLAMKCAGIELTDDQLGLHTCDNTFCIEETHLYAGTHKQNTADMMARGRYSPPPIGLRGKNHVRNKASSA
jgi:hypothetical protein